MAPRPPATPPLVIALVVVVAVAASVIFADSFFPALLGGFGTWPAYMGGFIALVVALAALWGVQRKRDRIRR